MTTEMIELLLSLDGVQRSKLLRQINDSLRASIEQDEPSLERAKFWMLLGDEVTAHRQ